MTASNRNLRPQEPNPNPQPPLKILISGGGVAGPAAAFWLSRLGHTCTIVERFPTLRDAGLQVDLRRQGIEVVEAMGLMDDIRAHVVDELGTRFVDSNGKQQALLPRVDTQGGTAKREQSLTSEFELMRSDVTKILHGVTKEKTEYRFGTSVADFENHKDHVAVTFADGSTDSFDLLIAADGQSSRIRKKLLADDPSLDYSRSLEMFVAYYTLPRQAGDENYMTFYHAPGKRALCTRWHSPDRGQGYLTTMSHQEELRKALKEGVESQKSAYASVYKDAGWQAERLIKGMYEADDFYAQEVLQRRSKIWSKGRVVLLGDAGYAPSPITGMGTSLALIGAYVLAGELSNHPNDLAAGLRAYDTTLRPFVDTVQNLAPGMPGLMVPETRWGIKILHQFTWFVSTFKIDALMGKIIPDDQRKWHLPEYSGLKVKT